MSGHVSGRFHSLDAMRGVAAIAVVFYHVSFFEGHDYAPGGNLAVDFFFALSGFVINRAYGDRLLTEMSVGNFTEIRLVRLYPLFFLGVLFGIVKEIAQIKMHAPDAPSWIQAAVVFVTNPLMLPSPGVKFLFPLNSPAWSLFLEIIINIVYAAFLVRLRPITLFGVAVTCGCALLYGVLVIGNIEFGPDWRTLGFGIARVGFSFPIGVLIGRSFRNEQRRQSYLFLVPILLLIAVLTLPISANDRRYFDAAMPLVFLPALLWLGAKWEAPKLLEKVSAFLGDISYPLYAVHYSVLIVFAHIQPKIALPILPVYLAFIAAMIVASALLVHFYDTPLRLKINRSLQLRRSAPAQIL